MLKRMSLLAMLVALAGCASHDVRVYSSIDGTNKTVTVPPGGGALIGKLKQTLAHEGWKMVVYDGPTVMEGTMGSHTSLKEYDTFNTRYRLSVSEKQFDVCLKGFSPDIYYDISMVDTKTGAEVFTVSGKGCEPDAVNAFIKALHGENG